MAADDAERVALRDRLASAVREAGAVALRTFRRDPTNWIKGVSSPVSEADIAVDALLRERLLSIRDAGWLSEETEDDPARLRREEVWVVDPIDGTRLSRGTAGLGSGRGFGARGAPARCGALRACE